VNIPGTEPALVLVIEDDAVTRTLISTVLRNSRLRTVEAGDGKEGLRRFFELKPDLVVLDMVMPKVQGNEVLERIRHLSDLPVLALSSNGGELEKVRTLRSGADDYVTKPFGNLELAARVETLLRRAGRAGPASSILSDDLVRVDFEHVAASADGKELTLTPLEFKLLATFVRHRNQVLSAEQIGELVWGNGGGSRDQVKLYVSYLRRRLREAASVEPIETVRGFGYRYRPTAAHLNGSTMHNGGGA
jgi:DNA-binding response OmpR family regulator